LFLLLQFARAKISGHSLFLQSLICNRLETTALSTENCRYASRAKRCKAILRRRRTLSTRSYNTGRRDDWYVVLRVILTGTRERERELHG